jgi:hypothetical protein
MLRSGNVIHHCGKPLRSSGIFLGIRHTRAARAVATRRRSGRKKIAAPARTTRSKRSTRTSVTVDSDEEKDEVQEVSDLCFCTARCILDAET